MATYRKTRFDEELGKAVADRLGLNLDTTAQDYRAEQIGGTVTVWMTTVGRMTMDEWVDLQAIAGLRAIAAAKAEA